MTAAIEIPELPSAVLPPQPWADRLFTQVSTALDATVLRAMQFVVERALIPRPENLVELRESATGILSEELQRDPGRFFAFREEELAISKPSERVHRSLTGGVAVRCKVQGAYDAYPFETGVQAGAAPSGQPILVERWVHVPQTRRGTIVTLHGFTMGNPRIDALALFANHWYRRGLDVALMTLPYHGARTPSDAHFSGDRFAVPHVARLSEAVREAIYEIRLVTRWLKSETNAPVGLIGLSLGGYLASLTASLCDEPDFVISMVPPVCFGDLAWRFFTQTQHYKRGGDAVFTKDELRAAFRVHSPLAHPLRVPRERVHIIAGRGDRIVPPEHPHALWQHWERPSIHWFNGSHLAPFGRGAIVESVLRHLRTLDVL